MSNVVVLLGLDNESGRTRLAECGREAESIGSIELRFVDWERSLDEVAAACGDAAAILVNGRYPQLVELAGRLPNLKLVQTFSAGTDWIEKAQLAELGVDVANNGGANAVAVAEHAIALMFSVYRKLDVQIESAKSGTWMAGVQGDRTEYHTLVGKRVGIVGLGRIGSRVAKRLAGWECEIVYHDVIDHPDDYVAAAGARRTPLDELLSTSDIVTCHVPLDHSTRAMMSSGEFGRMKQTAVFINTCRGPVHDEAALIKALNEGEIFGAGLDVTEIEPIEPDNPLLAMPNVVIPPHLATRAIESELNAAQCTIANAARVVHGEQADWVVPPA